mmetsp:Transcript_21345/g.65132  ORF Transcript_21345/g.65132 Transcript_21345/m.65132 type:complete len:269 (-) Transcript_21345:1134-1940(-)
MARASSGGTKFPMMRSLSRTCFVRSRMVSSMSSRSRWNSCSRSRISDVAAWYLAHSFLSLRVLTSTSSWSEPNCSSSCIAASSLDASSRASSRSCSLRSSSSSWARRSAASCCRALSMILPPWMSFSSILASRFCMFDFCASTSSRIFSSVASRSSSARRSASVLLCWFSISRMSSAARLRSCSFSRSALRRISATSSSVMPTLTIFSLMISRAAPPDTMLPFASVTGSAPASCALRRLISSWNSRSMASFGSSLIFGLFLMFLARFA